MFINKYHFDYYGCLPSVIITKQINGGIYIENQIQKNDSYCAAYCLYVLYLANIIGFNNAVLSLYYVIYGFIHTDKDQS